ncbi:cytochrome P450 78A5-like [Andrographis paniculata]|uniref:cytochrome P450 78A5-like n=1 Tax=Andrographis paniculata TaxID=175694 RepID=UPI0021E99E15|nr:cytochrome P450 78A5-like [Andrographis paniculata]
MCVALGRRRGGAAAVVVSSRPETAKEILRGSSFADRPAMETARLLMFDRAIGFAPSGEYWRRLRRIAWTHVFSPTRVLAAEGRRAAVAEGMAAAVREGMRERGVVDVREVVGRGALESVVESVFGSLERERVGELGFMVKEGYEVMGVGVGWGWGWGEYLGLGFLDIGGVRRRCCKLGIRVREFVGEIVRERRRSREREIMDSSMSTRNDDFLSVLLSLPKDDQLTDPDIVAVLWEMVFRGIDNIAILLEWTMARMVLHRDVQARVQKEIHMNVAAGKEVQDSDVPNLPYLQATVKEILRLHPPGPLLSWARLAIHDVHVDGCLIPAGTTAMVNMWAIAHDPSIWPDPWAFKPDRFMEREFSISGSDLRLAPFGSGRRACPGRALGLAAVHLWLARLLQRFEWIPDPAHPVDLDECLKLSLEMKTPLQCCAVEISEN